MKWACKILFLILPLCARAQSEELRINSIFQYEENHKEFVETQDYLKKYHAFSQCINTYIEKQSRSYIRSAQSNLYDLIHDFDKISDKVAGKRVKENSFIKKEERILALASIQCNTYYRLGILK